jgi:hypothetical protein
MKYLGEIEYLANDFTFTPKSKVNRCLKANALKCRAGPLKHQINQGLWRCTESKKRSAIMHESAHSIRHPFK